MLPQMSGYDVCRELRAKGRKMPILMLTARGQEIDKVLGLELGADDYITKPFSLRELLARVHAALRRTGAAPAELKDSFAFGEVMLDFKHYRATREGVEIEMTPKEFEILHYLIINRGNTVTRDDLLEHVWGHDVSPTTRTVDNHVLKLRKKLERDPANPDFIITVHGIGYKFIG
jgi:two-component system alkaline phosphatase synthesis response regulator PhoP